MNIKITRLILFVIILSYSSILFCYNNEYSVLGFNNYRKYNGNYFSIHPVLSYRTNSTNTSHLGYGVKASYTLESFFSQQWLLEGALSSYYHNPEREFIKVYLPTTLSILSGYRFGFNAYTFTPKIGPAYTVHYMLSDTDGLSKDGYYTYSNHFYYDPSIQCELETRIEFIKRFALVVNPGYTAVFEKDEIINSFSCGISIIRYY